ncbi:hypothetical protein [Nonomuraea typhae]|uniref:hypothetical protein n=1 Tax=Nonomuraea typhae TaxID=2603600 RepID=UPI0012FAC8EF|nr:hypothetical protein [Nonomuraea typhae]
MSRRVVRLDLRGSGDGATGEVTALLSDDSRHDLTSLLVVDDVATLGRHRLAYETLLASRYTDEVLCVAVGRADADPPRIALPGSLTQAAGVLWVPDPCGINWRLATAAPATRRDRREGPEAGLTCLLDVLTLADVFRETLRLIERIPGLVANPGIRLAWMGDGRSDFLLALRAACVRTLASGSARPPDFPAASAAQPALRPVRLRKGGPLANQVSQARAAVDEAAALGNELGEAMSLFSGPVLADTAVTAAGHSVGLLRDKLEELLIAAHGTARLDAGPEEAIDRAGVVLPPPEEFDAAGTRDSISAYLASGLDAGIPLPRLIEGLDQRQDRLMPSGSRALVPALHRACPDALVKGLSDPEPMPGPQPWLPAVGALAAAMAALSPFGPASGLVMALLWTLLVTLTVLRGPGARRLGHTGALCLNAAAAGAAGAVTGLVVTDPLPPPVWPFLLVAALAGAVWTVRESWRSRTMRWLAACHLDEAERAIDEMLSVAAAAAGEWARAGARIETADAVARMNAALAHVAAVLRDHVDQPNGHHAGPSRRDRRVEHFLADLVRAAMAPRLRALAAGSTAEHGEQAGQKTAELFAEWEEHVAQHGTHDPPPFATEWVIEAATGSDEDLTELTEAASQDPHAAMWQLCLAQDLSLLDVGTEPPAVVRFAPQHCRTAMEGALPAGITWVPSARHAGTLRLVPVRPGVAYQSWTDELEAEQEGRR